MAKSIAERDAFLKGKEYCLSLETIDSTSSNIDNLCKMDLSLGCKRDMIKKFYNTGYKHYVKCMEIQKEYPDETSQFFPSQEKARMDLKYRKAMKELREVKK